MNNFRHLLSEEEMSVWTNNRFMPLKARVWDKLESKLQLVHDDLRAGEILDGFPAHWRTTPGRIYRGEHYQSFSYRSLDIIRYSSGGDLALLRVVLLWGHPIGIHLILVGKPRTWWLEQEGLKLVYENDWWLSCHDNPWIWEFPHEGWKDLGNLTSEVIWSEITKREYLKVSRFLPVDQVKDLESFIQTSIRDLLKT